MKRWILSGRVEVLPDTAVMVRHGNSVCDGYYSKIHRQWFALIPGGTHEKIDPPEMLFLDEDWAREHQTLIRNPLADRDGESKSLPSSRRKRKPVQLSLAF